MNKKEISRLIKKHEWKKFLTRPYNLFFVSMHARAYHLDLPEITDFNCQHSLYISRGSMVDICRSTESSEEVRQFIYQIITDENKLKKLLETSKAVEQKIKEVTKKNKKHSQIDEASAKDYLKFYSRAFAILTAIPFNVGNAIIENNLEHNKKFSFVLSDFERLRSINYYQDFERYVLGPFFLFLSEKYNLSFSDIQYLTADEIEKLISGTFDVSSQELEKRKKQYIYLVSGQKTHLVCDNNLFNQLNKNLFSPPSTGKNIKGQIAYPGKAQGQIKIISRLDDAKDFKEGNILVSVSTNPELMPILRKAGAIVTDEGGLLSHAAILARELKIPCVIGTGNATKILKDGDFAEVNADKGEIKILP